MRAVCPDSCPATAPVLVPVAEGACSPESVMRCYHCREVRISRRTDLTDRKEGGSRPLPAPVAHAGGQELRPALQGQSKAGEVPTCPHQPRPSRSPVRVERRHSLLSTTLPAAYTGAGRAASPLRVSSPQLPALARPSLLGACLWHRVCFNVNVKRSEMILGRKNVCIHPGPLNIC